MVQTAPPGRPRSESARAAVLYAVDDLLTEIGYSAMTMKGIAERAGVGRQTVYRWWPTKAHILIEACADDARTELTVAAHKDPARTITDYLVTLGRFLTAEPAGVGYRALLGEAQHDAEVAGLVAAADLLAGPTRVVLDQVRPQLAHLPNDQFAVAELCGPIVLIVLTGGAVPPRAELRDHARRLVTAWT
jgi:AcrR family transcriptional regulator